MFCAPNAKILTEVPEKSYTPKNPVRRVYDYSIFLQTTSFKSLHRSDNVQGVQALLPNIPFSLQLEEGTCQMGGGVSKEVRTSLLSSVRKSDGYRTRAHLERMKGGAASVINSTKDTDGINLLCIAVRNASEPCVKALLEFRGDPNQACVCVCVRACVRACVCVCVCVCECF